MLAGTLTKRITLFRPKRIRQPLGSEKVVAEKVTEIWAKAEAISNKKFVPLISNRSLKQCVLRLGREKMLLLTG